MVAVDMSATTTPPDSRLRAAGLRATAPRVAVLAVLDESLDHPSVEQVRERVVTRLGGVSVQTVYATCETLRSAGLARRIEPAGQPARYESRAQPHHHHLVCRTCGAMANVVEGADAGPRPTPADTVGYEVEEIEITYWGRCPRCRPTTEAGSTP